MANLVKTYCVPGGEKSKMKDMSDGTYAEIVSSVHGVIASDGEVIFPDSLAETLVYNADGSLNYTQVVAATGTYRETLTYTSGKITGVSAWVKQ